MTVVEIIGRSLILVLVGLNVGVLVGAELQKGTQRKKRLEALRKARRRYRRPAHNG